MAVYRRTYRDQEGKSCTHYWLDFYYQGQRFRRPAGTSHREAVEALNRIKGRIASGEFNADDLRQEVRQGIPFDLALDIYREHWRAQGKRDRSYMHLAGLWAERWGKRRLSTITSEEIEATLGQWTRERQWSAATRNNVLMQLSGLYSFAYGRKWVGAHPIERGRVPLLPLDNARTRWLRAGEVEAIRDNAPEWLRPIVTFAVMTGMRLREICSLRGASVQRDNRGRTFIVTERTKNGDRLHWPVEGAALALVEEALRRAPFPASRLFPGPRGGDAETSIRRALPVAVRKAGLRFGRRHRDGVTFHVFRHSMASLALNNGIPESTVQRMGNWKTRTMVKRYAHLADETLRDAAGQLAAVVVSTGRSHDMDTTETRPESGTA